ncbi:coiled-coil domain-containing protein [Clostridium sp. Marseille-P3244]|uniref:coiled-coil domain-containing protein n=1 Tax=Clostridium sp. Marseille-P3244 TaxID=1871020 RepID=UPI0009313A18|nr:NlpC/P60 family protein [Clostridium sp. Marseille-P3244]
MKFKKVHSACLAAALTCSLAVTPVLAEPTQEELEDQKAAAQSELSDLQTELDTLIAKANELETELISTGEEILQAEEDLEEAEAKKEEQYEAMKLRIKYMYESGSGTATMEKVLTSGDFSDMVSQAEYSQKVHEYDRAQLQEYANTVTEIEDLHTKLETEMENLKATEAEYEAQQATLTETISSKQDEIDNLDEMIQEAARKAEEERRAAEAAAAAANNNNSGTVSSGGGNYTAPPYNAVTGNIVVDRAYGCLGLPYVWAATGPSSFDCSGLVGYCLTGSYSRLGTTYTFMGYPQVSDPQPGDICVNWEHCGIYIGNGQMIHAPQPGDVVKIGPVQSGMIYVRY